MSPQNRVPDRDGNPRAECARAGSLSITRESLRLLYRLADRPTCWRLAAAVAAIAASSILAALAPLALKELIDAVAVTGRADLGDGPPFALLAGALYLAALGGSRVLAEIRPALTGGAEQQLAGSIRQAGFAHLLRLPMAFHHDQPSGSLLQALQHAGAGTRMLLMALTGSVLPVVVEIACIAVILARLDQPALAVCILLSGAAHAVLYARLAAGLGTRSRDVVQGSARSHAIVADHLQHLEMVKCQNAEPDACQRLAESTDAERAHWARLHRQRSRIGIASTGIFCAAWACSMTLAGLAVRDGTLSVGGFVLANLYVMQLVRPIESLGAGVRDLVQGSEWLRPVLGMLNQPTEGPALTGPAGASSGASASTGTAAASAASRSSPPSLSARSLCLRHGDRPVLDAVAFDVAAGATLAIVGPSGSGKSSLLRAILRLKEVERGDLLLDGHPIADLPPASIRQQVGFVAQEAALLNASIAANIAFGNPPSSDAAILAAANTAGLADLLRSLPDGCSTFVGERGMKLSGGERQRVAIARAILRRPSLLILDEATSMLDAATESHVMRNLREACRGCTTVMAAHRLSVVAHADEILVLDRGRVAERGTHLALLAAGGMYARTWAMQAESAPA
ncbi:ABC transporter ATP-binding protein [Piscinibacter sakaiensis]|uniref:ABC transporter, ATP-binding protein n=1 Tax=Piscinibacter sakaiensis TaxID=1547922 RepID=A0A0K8P7Q7_PISS1|nr:ABC transporter ATP-binding protein [Piscinibacter sakaiensis]GAP38656.1 ABC transporter, ATP-binding protein [Piscinibacter sakaiensis]